MAQSNKPCQRCKPALIGKSLAECGRTMWSGKRVAVVIPAFNEAERIGATLRRLPDWIDEAIVVNDGSSDDTADQAYRVGDERVRVVTHGRNQGVGAAIRTGYKEAIGSCAAITVVMAADNQMDPTDLPALLAPVLHGQADYAKGNRFLHAAHKDMPAKAAARPLIAWQFMLISPPGGVDAKTPQPNQSLPDVNVTQLGCQSQTVALRSALCLFSATVGELPGRYATAAAPGHCSSSPRNRSALPMTETELRLMAAAAIIGLSSRPKTGYRTPAATGMPAAL